MKVSIAACQNCAAPLGIQVGVKFLNCKFCSSRLQVIRDGDSTLTQLCERADKLEDDLAELRKQVELETLEREWVEEVERHAVYSEHGRSLPERNRPHMGVVFGYGFGGLLFLGGMLMVFSVPADIDENAVVPRLSVQLPKGWKGPHYKSDGREYISGPKVSGITGGTPVRYTGRRVGKEMPLNVVHEFRPLRERHRNYVNAIENVRQHRQPAASQS